jgi:hypothetical protein
MPRVVIELQANTQDAVQKIQQFAKAQKDAFDAIRNATPALADASVKISKLTETTRASALVTGDLNRAAQDLAKGGIRDLLTEVPILGGTFAKLASTLTGFPGLMLGVVGAGVALIKMLQDMSAEASKTLASIEAMSAGIQTNLTATMNQIAQLRAARAGDQPGALQAGATTALDEARRERDAAIKAAGEKAAAAAPGMFSPENIMAKALGDATLLNAKLQGIADERRTAELAAEAAYQLKAFTIREKLAGDLEKLDAERVQNYEASREKEVAATAAAAEKEKAIWTQTTQDALTIFQGLGAGFEEALKPLQLEQFVEKTTQQIEVLNTAIDQGRDTQGHYAKAVELLTTKMNDAIKLGYVPMTAATKTATTAINESAAAASRAAVNYGEMATAAMAAASAQAALARAAAEARTRAELEQVQSHAATLSEAQGVLETYTRTPIKYQHGGLVPGVGPVPIIAHGGERIVPVHGDERAGAVQVRIEPGAVQLSGTIIDQQRGWGSLVEELGQALEARLRWRDR